MNSKANEGAPDTASPETEIQAVHEPAAPEVAPAPKAKRERKPKADVTLADLAERYIKHLEDDGKSPGTCSSYTAELKLAIKHLGGETPIASITPAQVGEFFESKPVTKLRSGRPKSILSVQKTQRVARQALEFAVTKKWLSVAPLPQPAAEQA